MIFTNINLFSVLLTIILLIITCFLLYLNFRKNIIENKTQIIFIFLSIFFLLVSILEPKWILKDEEITTEWWNIVFVLDISKSMNAIDFKLVNSNISRLEWAKRFINNFIVNNPQNIYWLNIFAWETIETLPLTSDIWLYSTVLNWITSDNLNNNWTNIFAALKSSTSYFDSGQESWLIVLISDGWDEEASWNYSNLLSIFKEKQLKLSIIWVWTKKWANIPSWTDFFWKTTYKVFNWKKVITKLNEKSLKNISSDLSWEYYSLSKYVNIKNIQENILESVNRILINSNALLRENYEKYFIWVSLMFFLLFLFYNNLIIFFNKWKK